jgi:hypothetical protein
MRKGPLRSHTRTALKLRLECAPWTEGHGRADNRAMAYSTCNVFRVRHRDPSDFTKAGAICDGLVAIVKPNAVERLLKMALAVKYRAEKRSVSSARLNGEAPFDDNMTGVGTHKTITAELCQIKFRRGFHNDPVMCSPVLGDGTEGVLPATAVQIEADANDSGADSENDGVCLHVAFLLRRLRCGGRDCSLGRCANL